MGSERREQGRDRERERGGVGGERGREGIAGVGCVNAVSLAIDIKKNTQKTDSDDFDFSFVCDACVPACHHPSLLVTHVFLFSLKSSTSVSLQHGRSFSL